MARRRWRAPDGCLDVVPAYYCSDDDCECDAQGFTFGKLLVVSGCPQSKRFWICMCKCGVICRRDKYKIVNSKEPYCGSTAHRADNCRRRFRTHGLTDHPLYGIWCHIKERCYVETSPAYKNYGARGISVCDEWQASAQSFIQWGLANGYRKGLELERRNNNKGYSPENCYWSTRKQQANNKRSNILIRWKNRMYTLAQAVEQFGRLSYSTAYYRYRAGKSVAEVLGL